MTAIVVVTSDVVTQVVSVGAQGPQGQAGDITPELQGLYDDALLARDAAQDAEAAAEAARDAAQADAKVYASVSAGLAATADGDQFIVPDGDRNVRYRRDSASVATRLTDYPTGVAVATLQEFGNAETRFLNRAARRASAFPRSLIVILLGQSLNAPRGTPVLAAAPAGSRRMVQAAATAEFPYNATNAEWFSNWSSVASDVAFSEGAGQTPLAGVAAALAGGPWATVYLASAALGARTVDTLMRVGPRTNVHALCKRFAAISRAAGYEPDIVFYSAHGEADAAAATAEGTYYAKALAWYRNCQIIAAQALERPDYVAPVFVTYPVQTNAGGDGERDRAIKSAIRRVVRDLPNGVDLGAIYQWPVESDRIHPTVASYVKRGEAVGRAIRDYWDARKSWGQSLQIVDATLSGATFIATFDREVVRDDSLGVGQNLNTSYAKDGFEWIDNGTQIAITGLAYSGRRVTGALASVPAGTIDQQVLRIASQTTTASSTAGAQNLAGSVVRAAGDGWRSISDPTYLNHVWATPQTFRAVRAA